MRFAQTVLVPEASGAAAIGSLKWLKRTKYPGRLIATDGSPSAAGAFFSDRFVVLGDINTTRAQADLFALIASEHISVILPTSPDYHAALADRKKELINLGCVLPCSDGDVVRVCQDKALFYETVCGKYPIPSPIHIDADGPVRYPCFVKPRVSSGSRGAARCQDRSAWLYLSQYSNQLLAQEILTGPEYSVDVLSDLEGVPLSIVIRERLAIRDGISTEVRIVRDPEIWSLCDSIARYLGLKGITCMQLRKDDRGTPCFIEINAHMAGTSIATMLAGVDLVRAVLSVAEGIKPILPDPAYVTVIRYFEELLLPAHKDA